MKHLSRIAVSGLLASLALATAAPVLASTDAPACGGDKNETPKPDPKPAPKPPSAL
jgi:hypothetical protein